MNTVSNIHGERLSITPVNTHRPCLDEDGNPIKDYYVASDGSVISTKRSKTLTMTPMLHPDNGFYFVRMQVNRTRTEEWVHRLVAYAWMGIAPTPDHRILSLDGDKANNAVSNLQWATQQEIIHHSHELGLVDRPMVSEDEAETMRELRRDRKTHEQIAAILGRSESVVGDVLGGRGKHEGKGSSSRKLEVFGLQSSMPRKLKKSERCMRPGISHKERSPGCSASFAKPCRTSFWKRTGRRSVNAITADHVFACLGLFSPKSPNSLGDGHSAVKCSEVSQLSSSSPSCIALLQLHTSE